MIIENLSLTDFRVFSGRHHIDLRPRKKYKKERPIILFGGLNGAGKTTILTAIRLALYGKQSLGHGVSKKAYDEFLAKSIHKSKQTLVQANTAQIELTFTYANMGIINRYTVKRSWINQKSRITETLNLYENEKELTELNPLQSQGFLNEIIPIGVSDLFFFDGEKIKDLALDKDGMALGASIKKLLGLDVIETLRADLSIYLRGQAKKEYSEKLRREIARLEKELDHKERLAEDELEKFSSIKPALASIDLRISNLEQQLDARGGAWAATRDQEVLRHDELSAEKKQLERSLRDVISGSYPISLAGEYARNTVAQLRKESDYKMSAATARLVKDRLSNVDAAIKPYLVEEDYKKISKAIKREFSTLTRGGGKVQIVHDVSEKTRNTIEATINDACNTQKNVTKELSERIVDINDEMDKAGKNIARAPEESTIMPIFEKVLQAQTEKAEKLAQQRIHVENHRKAILEAIEISRRLEKQTLAHHQIDEKDRSIRYAKDIKDLLVDFVREISQRKVIDLENEFIGSFHRLSRKEDTQFSAQIDPETYLVKLMRSNGVEVDKNDLSAGEKQIYAISILEALARTSGRHLPIIIDTPLGRLDSKHRSKLINRYFPSASHQVIILSTDTEVDEAFYADLSPHISHAYKLEYSSETGATTADEGYFWKAQQVEATL